MARLVSRRMRLCDFISTLRFLNQLPSRTRRFVTEPVRIFIWSLVQKVQEDHMNGLCPKNINYKTVYVVNALAFLRGPKSSYTEEKAIKNYQDIHKFLNKEIFSGCDRLPYSMRHFMNLLIQNPLDDHELISKHVAIMSAATRLNFTTNFMLFPLSSDVGTRKKFFHVIDDVTGYVDWNTKFRKKDKFFIKCLGNKKSIYFPDCPPVSTYFLGRFFRNCVQHCGVQRPKFKWTRAYQKWEAGRFCQSC